MPAKYMIEIYGPGSLETMLWHSEAPTPFMAMSEGDLIQPTMAEGVSSSTVFRITKLEHLIWGSGADLRHKICVYTARVEDTASARLEDTAARR